MVFSEHKKENTFTVRKLKAKQNEHCCSRPNLISDSIVTLSLHGFLFLLEYHFVRYHEHVLYFLNRELQQNQSYGNFKS
ncbi:hypothetical protein BpHYR1_003334 [Brachionus plicatilis]|uniref:Uncharacterized protein n=1 Tax=Brachionus plicatilis TaxID=10195 RepID=A0A3M7R9W6_BRAPC|nr:hypothetical protein BpHYR1_003334 [Brachionus plicatilis]